jgi:hypothetical protein
MAAPQPCKRKHKLKPQALPRRFDTPARFGSPQTPLLRGSAPKAVYATPSGRRTYTCHPVGVTLLDSAARES